MLGGLTGWHLLIILAVILLLFGAPKLPGLARSIGQSMRIFKGEVNEMKKDGEKAAPDRTADSVAPVDGTQAPAAPTPPPAPTAPSSESPTKP
jgi:sec-independent protein translocase protein TatA